MLFKGKLIYLQNITLHNSDILNIINDNGEYNPGKRKFAIFLVPCNEIMSFNLPNHLKSQLLFSI